MAYFFISAVYRIVMGQLYLYKAVGQTVLKESSHAFGHSDTARAFEIDLTMGVYASLGMCLNAILTPAVLPAILALLF